MKPYVGKIAVEGKHIVKEFQIGNTTTKVLKGVSLQVAKGSLYLLWGPLARAKVRSFTSLAGWMPQQAAVFASTAWSYPRWQMKT